MPRQGNRKGGVSVHLSCALFSLKCAQDAGERRVWEHCTLLLGYAKDIHRSSSVAPGDEATQRPGSPCSPTTEGCCFGHRLDAPIPRFPRDTCAKCSCGEACGSLRPNSVYDIKFCNRARPGQRPGWTRAPDGPAPWAGQSPTQASDSLDHGRSIGCLPPPKALSHGDLRGHSTQLVSGKQLQRNLRKLVSEHK